MVGNSQAQMAMPRRRNSGSWKLFSVGAQARNCDFVSSSPPVPLMPSGASNRVKFDDLSWTCYDTLGSENFELDEIKIIPNPAKQNMVRVTTKSNLNVEFYDVLGKKVLFKTITPTNNTIDVTNFNKGVYLVRLSNELNSVTKKLIIQ